MLTAVLLTSFLKKCSKLYLMQVISNIIPSEKLEFHDKIHRNNNSIIENSDGANIVFLRLLMLLVLLFQNWNKQISQSVR